MPGWNSLRLWSPQTVDGEWDWRICGTWELVSLCAYRAEQSRLSQPRCTGLHCLAHLQVTRTSWKWIPVNSSPPARLGDAWRTLTLFRPCVLQLCLLRLRALVGTCLSSPWPGKSCTRVLQKWGALRNAARDMLNVFSCFCNSDGALYSQGKCKLSLFGWLQRAFVHSLQVRFCPIIFKTVKTNSKNVPHLCSAFVKLFNPNSAWASLGTAAAVGLFNSYGCPVLAGYCKICFLP